MKSIIVVRYVLLEQFVLQFIINFLVCSILFMKTDVELQEESTKKKQRCRGFIKHRKLMCSRVLAISSELSCLDLLFVVLLV